MAIHLTCSLHPTIRASSDSSGKPDFRPKKSVSSTWWAPLFGFSSDPDYVAPSNVTTPVNNLHSEQEKAVGSRSKFSLGCFTEDKAKQLRKKTRESSSFHDIMYHSAIASRMASDVSDLSEK